MCASSGDSSELSSASYCWLRHLGMGRRYFYRTTCSLACPFFITNRRLATMRIGSYARILLFLVVVLLGISFYATDQAFYYRGKYNDSPQVKIVRQHDVIYGKFDPDRSAAYTCTTQKVVDSVGMVCTSPDNNISINCTVGGDPHEYFC